MKKSNLIVLACLALACGGCASINEAWMRSYVAIHDAADKALEKDVAKTNATPAVKPDLFPDATKKVEPNTMSNDIKPFVGRYSQGAKSTEYGEEIWIANWERMNIRIHANPGEFRGEGVPSVGPWYPILASVIPDGTITMQKTADGCTLTARDFVSTGGQAYRFEGWRCDGLGPRMQRAYTVALKQSEMHGGQFAWFATVEGGIK